MDCYRLPPTPAEHFRNDVVFEKVVSLECIYLCSKCCGNSSSFIAIWVWNFSISLAICRKLTSSVDGWIGLVIQSHTNPC